MKICIGQRSFDAQYLEIDLKHSCSLKKQLLRIVSKFFGSHSSLQCSKRINGIVGFSKTGPPPMLPKQQPSYRIYFVVALSDMGFGQYDSQTLCQMTSVCGDFLNKEFTAINQDV
jgi:hypothetical protein